MLKNVILALILVFQLGIWFVRDSPFDTEQARSEELDQHGLADVPLEQIAVVKYRDPRGEEVTLARRDGMWVVEDLHGFPAIQDKVSSAVASLGGLAKSDFRSSKRIMHENFEVTDENSQRLTVLAEDRSELTTIVIGKRDVQGSQGTFIRLADADDVFVSQSQELASAFSADPYSWINRQMFDLELQDRERLMQLRADCYRIEIEGQEEMKDDKFQSFDPPRFRFIRYVFERVQPTKDGEEVYWDVLEPKRGFEDLELQDQLLTSILQTYLSVQARAIVAAAPKPEHKIVDPSEYRLKVITRFREGEGDLRVETSRELVIGAPFDLEGKTVPNSGNLVHAKVSFPGNDRKQEFVFATVGTYPGIFLRDPKLLARQPKPPKKPGPPKLPK